MVYTLVVHLRAKSDPICISKLKNKLIEASQTYSKDKETVSWLVMQSVFDSREFTIVERYEQESSQKYHLENPYWKTFGKFCVVSVFPAGLACFGGKSGSRRLRRNSHALCA